MSSNVVTQILPSEIRLVRFVNLAHVADGAIVKLESKIVSLDDQSDQYIQFLEQRPGTQDWFRFLVQSWLTWNGSHEGIGKTHPELRRCFPDVYYPRYRWGDFVAISYIWGDRNDQRLVILDGKEIMISRNLEDALRATGKLMQTRPKSEQLYLWNDRMGIDQTSEEEINLALKQFSRIFATAYAVHVWTGIEAHESAKVFNLACEIDRSWDRLKGEKMDRAARKDGLLLALQTYDGTDIEALCLAVRDQMIWAATARYLDRNYWKRLWIVQELALANDLSVVSCGNSSIKINALWRLVRFLNRYPDILRLCMSSAPQYGEGADDTRNIQRVIARLRYIADLSWTYGRGHPSDLGRLVKASRESRQHLTQDKVYGLMGLMPPAVTAKIDVDRAKSPARVCADMARAFMQTSGDLQILKFCGGFESTSMPSWAVNLLNPRVSTSALDNGLPFRAGGRNKCQVAALDETGILLRGCIVDTVQTTTVSCAPDPKPGTSSDTTRSSSTCVYEDVLQLKDALWRTLVANRAYHSFSDAVDPQRVLLEMPWTFDLSAPHLDLKGPTTTEFKTWTDQLDSFRTSTKDFDVFGRTLSSLFPERHAAHLDWRVVATSVLQMSRTLELRRLMTTTGGRLGICPEGVKGGESLVVVPGCSEPLAISKVPSLGEGIAQYRLLGPCYVDQFMDGQALHAGFELEDIVLV